MFSVLSNKCCVLCTLAIAGALSNTPQWRPGADRVCGRHSGVGVSRLQSADASLCLTGTGSVAPPILLYGVSLSLTLCRVKDIHLAVLLPALRPRGLNYAPKIKLKQLIITGEQRQHFTLVMCGGPQLLWYTLGSGSSGQLYPHFDTRRNTLLSI